MGANNVSAWYQVTYEYKPANDEPCRATVRLWLAAEPGRCVLAPGLRSTLVLLGESLYSLWGDGVEDGVGGMTGPCRVRQKGLLARTWGELAALVRAHLEEWLVVLRRVQTINAAMLGLMPADTDVLRLDSV